MNADFVDKDITFGPECGGPGKPPLDRTQRPRQSVNCQIHSETCQLHRDQTTKVKPKRVAQQKNTCPIGFW
jgi:hypothetical protein